MNHRNTYHSLRGFLRLSSFDKLALAGLEGLGMFLVALFVCLLVLLVVSLFVSVNVPGGSVRLSACLLQLRLLRRTWPTSIADRQHPGRFLVGHRYHDNGRIR